MNYFGIRNNKIFTFSQVSKLKKDTPILKSKNLKILKEKSGKGTYVDEKSLILKAAKDGFLRISDKIYVDNLEIIESNFDLKHSMKNFESSLWIKGDVLSGSSILVDGNLQIDGTVENCTIKCNGNVIVKGNIYGQNKANIFVKGDIFAKSITGAKIVTYGKLIVDELIRHSTIFSAKSLLINNKGEIIGGKTYIKDSINAKVLGSGTIIKTDIFLGYNFKMKFLLEQIKNELKKNKILLKKNKEFLEKKFNIILKSDNDYIDFVMKNLQSEESYKNFLLKAIENIKLIERNKTLELKVKKFPVKNLTNLNCFLNCNTIYPGVTLKILDKKLEVINKITGELNINRENIETWQQL